MCCRCGMVKTGPHVLVLRVLLDLLDILDASSRTLPGLPIHCTNMPEANWLGRKGRGDPEWSSQECIPRTEESLDEYSSLDLPRDWLIWNIENGYLNCSHSTPLDCRGVQMRKVCHIFCLQTLIKYSANVHDAKYSLYAARYLIKRWRLSKITLIIIQFLVIFVFLRVSKISEGFRLKRVLTNWENGK